MTCTCERCQTCSGRGYIWKHMDGDISTSRCDDLDESIRCPDCNGSGFDYECEECALAEMDGDSE